MKILYVLDRPELCGGVKVVLQHAHLLGRRGNEVTVCGRGRRPSWSPWRVPWIDLERRTGSLARRDLVIATFWTTVSVAFELAAGPVAHFCQGFEGDTPHLADHLPAIEAVYRVRIPTLVASPHLGRLVERRFARRFRVTPPPVDPAFRPASRRRLRSRPHVAIHGIYESAVKDVPTGLETVIRLRRDGLDCRLVRFSLLRQSTAERAQVAADKFFCRISPKATAKKIRRCDLLLFPSLDGEGFGLPLLEAMASGIPAVASDIPATRFVTGGAVDLVSPGDSHAFVRSARAILNNPERWWQAGAAGIDAACRFSSDAVADGLEEAMGWAISEAKT